MLLYLVKFLQAVFANSAQKLSKVMNGATKDIQNYFGGTWSISGHQRECLMIDQTRQSGSNRTDMNVVWQMKAFFNSGNARVKDSTITVTGFIIYLGGVAVLRRMYGYKFVSSASNGVEYVHISESHAEAMLMKQVLEILQIRVA